MAELARTGGHTLEEARDMSLDELELTAAVARRQTAQTEARRAVQLQAVLLAVNAKEGPAILGKLVDELNREANDYGNDRTKHR